MPHSSKKEIIAISTLAFISLIIRIMPAIKQSVFFGFDQGLDLILTKQLVADHSLSLVSRYSGLQGILMGPLWTWLLAIPFLISGGDPGANVVFLGIFSVLCGLLSYLLISRILGKEIALITLIFLLFAPYFVASSQIVLSPHPLTFIFFFYLYLLYEIFFRQKNKLIWLLGLLCGILFQFEIAFAIFTIPPVIFFFLRSVYLRKNPPLKHLAYGIIFFIATFLPQVIFDIRHDYIISRNLLSFFAGGNDSLYKISPPLQHRIIERVMTFRNDSWEMTVASHNLVLIIPVIILTLAGWYKIFQKKIQPAKNFFLILLVVLAGFFTGFSLYPGAIWGWYRQGLPIVYVFLISIPLGILLKENFINKFLILILGAIFVWTAVNPIRLIRNIRSPIIGGAGSVRSQKDVLDFIYKDARGKTFSYYAYTPPVYDYIWQYDFWWYGQKTYGYLPKNFQIGVPLLGTGKQAAAPTADEGLFYLIIEPDTQRPWAPNGWKESFIKIGKTINIVKIGSITIEKRE